MQGRDVFLAFGEDVVHGLCEELALVRDHASGSLHEVAPDQRVDIAILLEELRDHVHAVVFEGRLGFRSDGIQDPLSVRSTLLNGSDLELDDLTELLNNIACLLSERERLGWVCVEENRDEHGRHDEVELLLSEQASGVLIGFERQVEELSREVHMSKVSNVADDVNLVQSTKLVALLLQQLVCDVFVESLDFGQPFLVALGDHPRRLALVKRVLHELSRFGIGWLVT